MSNVVLDASALLAYLGNEQGADKVENTIANGACISTVNWAEVLSKLTDRGQSVKAITKELITEGLIGEAIELVPFTADDAEIAAELRAKTKSLGLSLADRSCLALGLRLKLPVITSDKSWAKLKLDIAVRSIR
jgi:PIN domain nuclease of toxin-antitoxin system